ncbi:C2 protein [Grapevine red blotch virus]|uniref:C2 protein n=1 Tax=Grapevine red blotch virus TaxID=1381007 RepID=W8QV06_9GEMI|nr:C2 protein [Grapevine red blotch virus]AHL69796.1 C2 protein [Grapevine red blotch virus]WBA90087.1 C2 protein [Grapevine red blotch virus]WBA90094.1 C2 protein [Grapevine red blotch virus]
MLKEYITLTMNSTMQEATHRRRKSLVIEGPSKTGKTQWAMSLGIHNYWCESVDFSLYIDDALYNIIDDIPFQYLPCKKALLGCQFNYIANEKYRPKRKIKGGIPSIVLCNPDNSYYDAITNWHATFKPWAEENIIFVKIDRPLY